MQGRRVASPCRKPPCCLHPLLACADNAPLPDDVALGNETVIISYLKPNVTINMVDDFTWVPPEPAALGSCPTCRG